MVYEKLPDIIKLRRKARGWRKAELARRANVSPATISLIEAGHWNIGVEVLCKIASALGTTATKLLSDSTRLKDA